MTKVINLLLKRSIIHVVSTLAISAAMTLPAQIHLAIKNIGSQPVTVELLRDNYNCYEGPVPVGQIWENLAPGASAKMELYRVGGHGCNGKQGEFELKFTPGVGVYTNQHFDFDNDGGMELSSGHPNPYPGKLINNGPANYTYTTFKGADVKAGPAIGRWVLLCQQICNYSTQDARSTQNTSTKTYTEEEKQAIAATLEAGVEVEGVGSAKSTVTASFEKTNGKSMSESFTRGETWTDTRTYSYTQEQMIQYNIFAVWQWIAETYLSDGTIATVRITNITCTPNARRPEYLPGGPEDLKACRNGR